MADAKSITFRPAVPSDAQVVAAIVNGAYRGDATPRGWTSEADFIAGPRIDEAGLPAQPYKDAGGVLLGQSARGNWGYVHPAGRRDGVDLRGPRPLLAHVQGPGVPRLDL